MLIVAIVMSMTVADKVDDDSGKFKDYKKKFNRKYRNADEEVMKMNVYMKNKERAKMHNQNKTKRYKEGDTIFSDLTEA